MMNNKLNSLVAAALAGSVLMSFGTAANADATFDLLNTLVEKGVLTEEEALPLMKGHASDEKKLQKSISKQVAGNFPVKVSHTKKGFRFETDDGKFQTNLLWRAQLRFTTPTRSDPRNFDDFEPLAEGENTFEARRVRMKIGGHAYEPWLKYYFEVDLQPTRSTSDGGEKASARVIDWRVDVAKYDFATLRVGQWKINYNRERVDSSGKQQFVERSIVNRQFTIDRQVGAQLTGHLFKGTTADMNYWAGVYTGEGRGVKNDDNNLMTMARVQWNPFGRALKWQQTDVEYTDKPTASISLATASNTGKCTRWSSSGCGNLDGFSKASAAANNQYEIDQYQQGSAFKYKGFSWQQEYHIKDIKDTVDNQSYRMKGGYAQAGYFFIPKRFEMAARYARLEEPNETNKQFDNVREEFTIGANWFLFDAGHNNKLTADISRLTLDDGLTDKSYDDTRFRLQWDVSY
jgi:phosphate-selective porin